VLAVRRTSQLQTWEAHTLQPPRNLYILELQTAGYVTAVSVNFTDQISKYIRFHKTQYSVILLRISRLVYLRTLADSIPTILYILMFGFKTEESLKILS